MRNPLKHGKVSIEGEHFITEAYFDPKDTWNGWIQPLIPVDNIGIFKDGYSITKTKEGYLYRSEHSGHEQILTLETIEGREFLHINTGLCFSIHIDEE